MRSRLLSAAVTFVVGVLAAYLLALASQLALGGDGGSALGLVAVFGGVGLAVWAALLVLGAVRGRGLGHGTLGGILAAVIAAVVDVVAMSVVAIASGGADLFVIALAVLSGLLLLAGAVVGALVAQMPALRWRRDQSAR